MQRPEHPKWSLTAIAPGFFARTRALSPGEAEVTAKKPCKTCTHQSAQLNCTACVEPFARRDDALMREGQPFDLKTASIAANVRRCPCMLVYASRIEVAEERRGASIATLADALIPTDVGYVIHRLLGEFTAEELDTLTPDVTAAAEQLRTAAVSSARRTNTILKRVDEMGYLDRMYLLELALYRAEQVGPQVFGPHADAITQVLCYINEFYRS